MLREKTLVYVQKGKKVRAGEEDTGTSPYQEQSTAGQAEPNVRSTGGLIKALR